MAEKDEKVKKQTVKARKMIQKNCDKKEEENKTSVKTDKRYIFGFNSCHL